MSADGREGKRKAGMSPACPVCGRPRVAKYRPFCSARCAQRDLGNWLKGSYRIPTNEEPRDTNWDMDGGEKDIPESGD